MTKWWCFVFPTCVNLQPCCCWRVSSVLTVWCVVLQLTGPAFIPVGMCVSVHEWNIRVAHSSPSCSRSLLTSTSSCCFSYDSSFTSLFLLVPLLGAAGCCIEVTSFHTASNSDSFFALPFHLARVFVHSDVAAVRSRPPPPCSSWLPVLSIRVNTKQIPSKALPPCVCVFQVLALGWLCQVYSYCTSAPTMLFTSYIIWSNNTDCRASVFVHGCSIRWHFSQPSTWYLHLMSPFHMITVNMITIN